MKPKWIVPFTPTLAFAFPPPSDVYTRWIAAVGVLAVVAIYLGIVQPWREDVSHG